MPVAVAMARVIVVVSVAAAMVQDMAPVVEPATAQIGKQYFGSGVHNSWRDPTSKGV